MSLKSPGWRSVNVSRKNGKSNALTTAQFYEYLKRLWVNEMTKTRVTIDGIEVPDVKEVRLDQSNDYIDVSVHGDPNKTYLRPSSAYERYRLLDIKTEGGQYVVPNSLREFDYRSVREMYQMDPVVNKVLDRMQKLEQALSQANERYEWDMAKKDNLHSKIDKQSTQIRTLTEKIERLMKKLKATEARVPKDQQTLKL